LPWASPNGKTSLQLDKGLMEFLESFSWPGNVRQLRNVVENMVVLSRTDLLTVENLPASLECDPLLESGRVPSGTTSLVALQRSAVEKALMECNGHRTRAAESLGISVRTLQRKLKAWGLEKGDSNGAEGHLESIGRMH
jgi:two-component system, NtrC family, response regulator HydG